jgi:hypothetical protein
MDSIPAPPLPPTRFNPHDQGTYRLATSRQLVIDGKNVWSPIYSGKRKTRSSVSEQLFVVLVRLKWKNHCIGQRAWDLAVSEVKQEFQNVGKSAPDDKTPGFTDRVREVYQDTIKQLTPAVPKTIPQDIIEDQIHSFLQDMDHRMSIRRKK